MYANDQKLTGYVRTGAEVIARLYKGFCGRWTGRAGDDATMSFAMRLIGAICLLPVALLGAFMAAGMPSNILELAILLASLVGMSMILCALTSLNANRTVIASAALVAYCAGLGIAAANAGVGGQTANAALWLLTFAVPLESWLVGRSRISVLAGVIAAAPVLAIMAFPAPAMPTSSSLLATLVVLIVYAGSLLFRFGRFDGRLKTDIVQTSDDSDLEAALDAMVVRLGLDGTILSVSNRSAAHLGLLPDVLTGTALIERIHVNDRVLYLSMLADLRTGVSDRIAARDLRVRIVRASGAGLNQVVYRSFQFDGSARKERGVVSALTLIARDNETVTEMAEQLAATRTSLHEATVSRGRVLAAVSHELRTPLNSIIGFSDLLLHEMGCRIESEKQREYIALIQRSGVYLLDVVNSILDASKIEAGQYHITPSEFMFRDAVAMAIAIMDQQAQQKSIILCDRVSAATGTMVADQRAVQQILINLVSNAVKFTEEGGCVTIDARRETVDGTSQMVFSVSDNGIGIDMADLNRIGQPYIQADNAYTRRQVGTGLGLSLVKGLVELHQGTLDISSSPGRGTVVSVSLPLLGPYLQIEAGDDEQEVARVIDMRQLQVERHNDRPQSETEEQGHAQNRKTA